MWVGQAWREVREGMAEQWGKRGGMAEQWGRAPSVELYVGVKGDQLVVGRLA